MRNAILLSKISRDEAIKIQTMLSNSKYDAFDIGEDEIRVVAPPTITKAGKKTEHDYVVRPKHRSCECENFKREHEGSQRGCKHLNFIWFVLGYVDGDLDLLEAKSGIPI